MDAHEQYEILSGVEAVRKAVRATSLPANLRKIAEAEGTDPYVFQLEVALAKAWATQE